MLIDLCRAEGADYRPRFESLLAAIAAGDDRLRQNYASIPLDQFRAFSLWLEDDEIVAFSGLQHRPERWGEKSARILSRYYIVPAWRHRYSLFQPDGIFGRRMFAHQLAVARELGLAHVFLSRDSHPRAFAEFVAVLREDEPALELLPGRYRVCGPGNFDAACVQYVARLRLAPGEELALPAVTA